MIDLGDEIYDVFSDINDVAVGIHSRRQDRTIRDDCVALARSFEPLLYQKWQPEDQEGVDLFLRNAVMMCYEKCGIDDVGFVARLRDEDVLRRFEVLRGRFLRIASYDVNFVLCMNVYKICDGLNSLCNEILYPGSVDPTQSHNVVPIR